MEGYQIILNDDDFVKDFHMFADKNIHLYHKISEKFIV